MKSFEQTYLERLQIPHSLINIIRQIGEYKGKQELYIQQAPEMLENLRQVAVIQSTESSNRLEGITADFKRIKELVENNSKPANRFFGRIPGVRESTRKDLCQSWGKGDMPDGVKLNRV